MTITADQLAEMAEALALLPRGKWEVWSSNSYRRITAVENGRSGQDGGVLRAYNQWPDKHPDLSMSEKQLKALCDLKNLCAEIIDANQL